LGAICRSAAPTALYAEQINDSPFAAPRTANERSGLYRVRPTVRSNNRMLPHGPDAVAFEAASAAELKPHEMKGTMALMFEMRFPQQVTA
jgi:homogentisate 1,2-dioxygenase